VIYLKVQYIWEKVKHRGCFLKGKNGANPTRSRHCNWRACVSHCVKWEGLCKLNVLFSNMRLIHKSGDLPFSCYHK